MSTTPRTTMHDEGGLALADLIPALGSCGGGDPGPDPTRDPDHFPDDDPPKKAEPLG